MNWIIVGIFIGAVFGFFIAYLRLKQKKKSLKASEIHDIVVSRSMQKTVNKQKIIDLISTEGQVTNAEIREVLDVSPRTVVNYTSELEKEGIIKQVGSTGRSVHYGLR